jgi:putative membrane protein
MSNMEYMFQAGFFGTRAPLFMDFVTFIVAALPLLMMGIIMLARAKKYKLHALMQGVLYIVSVIVVFYFEYGVRVGGGFDYFMKDSGVGFTYALVVLIIHILTALATLLIWTNTLVMAKKHLDAGTHKSHGRRTFVGVVFTSLTGIWVYMLMFIF